jgi:hypothetical protein
VGPESIERFHRILDWSDSVFEEFSGWFNGKTSPVHLFWHSLDLAVTRFSGRAGEPIDADPVTREAYTHEVISFGYWPGDDNVGDAAYYSYTAPEPAGLRDQPLPIGAWTESGTGSLAVLPYETVRTRRHPERHSSRSAKAPTKQVPASPAGTPAALNQPGAPPRLSSVSSRPSPLPTSPATPNLPDQGRAAVPSAPGRSGQILSHPAT